MALFFSNPIIAYIQIIALGYSKHSSLSTEIGKIHRVLITMHRLVGDIDPIKGLGKNNWPVLVAAIPPSLRCPALTSPRFI
jgi:hypothetical protein